MKQFWIVDTNTKKLIELIDDSQLCSIGFDQAMLEVPEGVSPANCKVEIDENGELMLLASVEKNSPLWSKMRKDRNAQLQSCDWTHLLDSPLEESKKAEWAIYRQALRDLPQQTETPELAQWPSKPDEG